MVYHCDEDLSHSDCYLPKSSEHPAVQFTHMPRFLCQPQSGTLHHSRECAREPAQKWTASVTRNHDAYVYEDTT